MVEPVRLVVWDLDETFWRGTLTEGGISYRQDCHDIVVELARRGILSAICSKAVHYVPELQIADETAIPGLLDNPLLQGKDDAGFTRLAQYKLLERRKRDETAVVDGQGESVR
jgi:hypothetical protein